MLTACIADESQHHGRYPIDQGIERMIGLHERHKDEQADPLLTIRFNPHTYHCFGEVMRVSGSDEHQAIKMKDARMEKLAEVINAPPFGPENSLRVPYMYYDIIGQDADSAHLTIWDHQDYCQEFRKLCLAPLCDGRKVLSLTNLWHDHTDVE